MNDTDPSFGKHLRSTFSWVLIAGSLFLIALMLFNEWSVPYGSRQSVQSAMFKYSSKTEFAQLQTGLKTIRAIRYDRMLPQSVGFTVPGPSAGGRSSRIILHIPYYETGYKNPYVYIHRITGSKVWVLDGNGKTVHQDSRSVKTPNGTTFLSQITIPYDYAGVNVLIESDATSPQIGIKGSVEILPYTTVLKALFVTGYLRRVIGFVLLMAAITLFTIHHMLKVRYSRTILEDACQFFALFGIWIMLDFARYDFWILSVFRDAPPVLLTVLFYFSMAFMTYSFSSLCFHMFSDSRYGRLLNIVRIYALILGLAYFSLTTLNLFVRSPLANKLYQIASALHLNSITIGSLILLVISLLMAITGDRKAIVFTVGLAFCEATFIISQATPLLISHWGVLVLGLSFVYIISMEFNATKQQNSEYTTALESKNRELSTLYSDLEGAQHEILYLLGSAVDMRSKETSSHVKRVAEYSRIFAESLGYSRSECDLIALASTLHDIGKVGISDTLLNKPGRLNPQEFELMKHHAVMGYDMLKESEQELIRTAAIIALNHHERYDGTGYPNGFKGDEIHPYGRIVAASDVLDALLSPRVYKDPWSFEQVQDYFTEQRGVQFEPEIVDIFISKAHRFKTVAEDVLLA